MHSIQAYLERRTTEELRKAIREHLDGTTVLPKETVAMISAELAKRNPDA